MDTSFIIAQIFGVMGIIASVLSMQFKKRHAIIFALLLLNIFAILSLVFLGQFSGAYISLFAVLEISVNYCFERRRKPIPKSIITFYVLANIAIGALAYKSIIDLLPILAALIFCFTLLTKKEQNIRKETICNQICWGIYDFSVGAYAFGVSNVLTLISTTIAIYRFRKKQKTVRRDKTQKKTKPVQKTKKPIKS